MKLTTFMSAAALRQRIFKETNGGSYHANKRLHLDLAKYAFEGHTVDDDEQVVLGKTLRRDAVAQLFVELEPCVAGMKACCGSHYEVPIVSQTPASFIVFGSVS